MSILTAFENILPNLTPIHQKFRILNEKNTLFGLAVIKNIYLFILSQALYFRLCYLKRFSVFLSFLN